MTELIIINEDFFQLKSRNIQHLLQTLTSLYPLIDTISAHSYFIRYQQFKDQLLGFEIYDDALRQGITKKTTSPDGSIQYTTIPLEEYPTLQLSDRLQQMLQDLLDGMKMFSDMYQKVYNRIHNKRRECSISLFQDFVPETSNIFASLLQTDGHAHKNNDRILFPEDRKTLKRHYLAEAMTLNQVLQDLFEWEHTVTTTILRGGRYNTPKIRLDPCQ